MDHAKCQLPYRIDARISISPLRVPTSSSHFHGFPFYSGHEDSRLVSDFRAKRDIPIYPVITWVVPSGDLFQVRFFFFCYRRYFLSSRSFPLGRPAGGDSGLQISPSSGAEPPLHFYPCSLLFTSAPWWVLPSPDFYIAVPLIWIYFPSKFKALFSLWPAAPLFPRFSLDVVPILFFH